MKTQHHTVLNSQAQISTDEQTIKALCQTLPSVIDDDDNKWLPLIPLGAFSGRDGRSWVNDNPEQVINNTQLPFILDIDHFSETTPTTAASGWITQLKVEDDHIVGLFEFNSIGKQAIADKRYKFYSPAFLAHKDNGTVYALCSVGLTNKPNLYVPALNAEQLNQPNHKPSTNQKDNAMLEALLQALGLSADTDQATAIAKIKELKANPVNKETNAQQVQQPDLNSFVPKATHEQTVTELNNANALLAELETAKHNESVEVAINKAIADKKIAPADKDYYTAQCSTEQGLADFTKFADGKAAVIGESNLPNTPPTSNAELNTQDIQQLESMGIVL